MTLSAPLPVLKSRAKGLARAEGLPLHAALDRIAVQEGYRAWSHLSAAAPSVAEELYPALAPGDLTLIAARPGRGKTLLALELALAGLRAGRPAQVFSLDYTRGEVLDRLEGLGASASEQAAIHINTADEIDADFIAARTAEEAVVVVDYLQILDQRRETPPLAAQVRTLRRCAEAARAIVLCLSQVHRSFDEAASRRVPTLADLRLPNPMDLSQFTKACFLGDGARRFERMGAGGKIAG